MAVNEKCASNGCRWKIALQMAVDENTLQIAMNEKTRFKRSCQTKFDLLPCEAKTIKCPITTNVIQPHSELFECMELSPLIINIFRSVYNKKGPKRSLKSM